MASRFVYRPQVVIEIRHSAEMGTAMLGVAEAIAGTAKQIAPVLTGAYVEGIEAGVSFDTLGAIGRVTANDRASGYIEFGTSDTPTFAPLRRAAESVVGTVALTRR